MKLDNKITELISGATLADGLAQVTTLFPEGVVFSSSLGQEDQVIADAIFKNKFPIKVFTLDTGRLFNETYDLIERTTARYKETIQIYFPEANDVESFVNKKGINGFYESVENRKECCFIRKVKPLNRALAGAKVWVTGLRAAQSDNRKELKMIAWDEGRQLYKFNPLMNWSYDEVLEYLNENKVPYNPLHDKGLISIGCAPCTRAIEAGEDARAGRWWWEASKKECGLHVSS